MFRHSVPVTLLAAAAIALVTACGGNAEQPGSRTGQSGSPSASNGPMDLVYISDSSGWQVADLYATRISKALGRQVRVTDFALPALTAVDALAVVKHNAKKIVDAEIIVVGGSPRASLAGPANDACVAPDPAATQPVPKVDSVADLQPFRDDLDAIYAEIWTLRDGAPVILRAVDYFVPMISEYGTAQLKRACTANYATLSRVIRATAQANGATMVSVYDVFNGLNHQADPRTKGYIGDDGTHASAKGAAVIADTLAAAGYASNTKPTQ